MSTDRCNPGEASGTTREPRRRAGVTEQRQKAASRTPAGRGGASKLGAMPAARTLPTAGVQGRTAASAGKGVVYTQAWVVELLLDLADYRPERDLAELCAVEPSAGEGAFLVAMARRLARSLHIHGRPVSDAIDAVRAWELDAGAARVAMRAVVDELVAEGCSKSDATKLARGWLTVGDYLLDAGAMPAADVVVGNPPYIRYDDLPNERYRSYRSRYPTMAGRCDLYVGFIEAAVRQLAPGGRLAFICADRWMRSAYGARLRALVAEQCGVEVVIEMYDAPAFNESVAAYPAVIVFRRAEQGPVIVARAGQPCVPIACAAWTALGTTSLRRQVPWFASSTPTSEPPSARCRPSTCRAPNDDPSSSRKRQPNFARPSQPATRYGTLDEEASHGRPCEPDTVKAREQALVPPQAGSRGSPSSCAPRS